MIGLGHKSDLVFLPCQSAPKKDQAGKKKKGTKAKKGEKAKKQTHTAESYINLCITKKTANAVRNGIFMQDNSGIHTARTVQAEFERLKMNVLRSWPPHSPDLNPIEQIWGLLKRRVSKQPNLHHYDGLKAAIQDQWGKIQQSTID